MACDRFDGMTFAVEAEERPMPILLWLLGIPIPIILLLLLFFHH